MELNYLILAHKNPNQLARLISNLQAPQVNFYIHVDASVDDASFRNILKSYENVYFLPIDLRKNIVWGDISIVEATINLMKRAPNHDIKGYFLLLSAQDYPLANNKRIRNFLEMNYGTCYISLFKLPHHGWKNGGMDRIEKYKINKSRQRRHFLMMPSLYDPDFYSVETVGKLNYLRKSHKWKDLVRIFKKRKFPLNSEVYGGGQWWAFPADVVKNILSFHHSHPEYFKYHRYSLAPDELFFHSILMHLKLDDSNIEKSLTYVNWERNYGPLPVTFEKQDFKELKKASKNHLFARKFDINIDESILDKIDSDLIG